MRSLSSLKVHCKEQNSFIKELLTAIQGYYGPRLISTAIYGSYARGTPRFNSDLDLFIVLKDEDFLGHCKELYNFTDQVELPLETGRLALETFGISLEISPTILSCSKASHFNPLYLDMVDEAVIAIDHDGFFRKQLEKTKEQMKRWGSRKIMLGNCWAWQIRPNLRWGDKIDYE